MIRLRKESDPARARALSEVTVSAFLRALQAHFALERLQGRSLALYRGMLGEFDLRSLETRLYSLGCRVYFPRVAVRSTEAAASGRQLEFVEALLDGAWQKGPYDIDEPAGGGLLADPSELAAVFMPGSAFGMNGERIGMGAGYYDRWLATHSPDPEKRPLRIALAFDYQVFPKLEQNAWDLPVDWVFTERHDFRNPAALNWLGRLGA